MLSHSQGYLVTEIFMWYLMSSMSIASTLSRLSTNHWLNLSNERRGLNTCCSCGRLSAICPATCCQPRAGFIVYLTSAYLILVDDSRDGPPFLIVHTCFMLLDYLLVHSDSYSLCNNFNPSLCACSQSEAFLYHDTTIQH